MADRSNRVLVQESAHSSEPVERKETLSHHRRRGSALLLVLFAIILLSGLITATVAFVSNDVDEYGALNKEFRARQLAESGLAFGIDPQVQNQDRALLEQQMRDGGRFHVIISSESTKLNINFLLQNGRGDLLSNLFVRWGVALKPANAAVEGLQKYLSKQVGNQLAPPPVATPTPSTSPAAASTNDITVQFATLFRSVAEMSLVPEFGPVMQKRRTGAIFLPSGETAESTSIWRTPIRSR